MNNVDRAGPNKVLVPPLHSGSSEGTNNVDRAGPNEVLVPPLHSGSSEGTNNVDRAGPNKVLVPPLHSGSSEGTNNVDRAGPNEVLVPPLHSGSSEGTNNVDRAGPDEVLVPLHSEAPSRSPPTVTFCAPLAAHSSAQVVLSNPSNSLIAFKIRCNAMPDPYDVPGPAYGVLKKKERRTITIRLQNVEGGNFSDLQKIMPSHAFQILTTKVKKNKILSNREWQTIKRRHIQQTILKVVLVQGENTLPTQPLPVSPQETPLGENRASLSTVAGGQRASSVSEGTEEAPPEDPTVLLANSGGQQDSRVPAQEAGEIVPEEPAPPLPNTAAGGQPASSVSEGTEEAPQEEQTAPVTKAGEVGGTQGDVFQNTGETTPTDQPTAAVAAAAPSPPRVNWQHLREAMGEQAPASVSLPPARSRRERELREGHRAREEEKTVKRLVREGRLGGQGRGEIFRRYLNQVVREKYGTQVRDASSSVTSTGTNRWRRGETGLWQDRQPAPSPSRQWRADVQATPAHQGVVVREEERMLKSRQDEIGANLEKMSSGRGHRWLDGRGGQ
uniref:MSP domain-containing protein n=1 Tax=Chromera velia CCMP2878 TaxID=1169474 RepID=A0A0G4GVK5_9ALVE|eukprot:Cvel_5265.t1-p1 / transcript=Cvel_5265.t1 / gene=Cvel_5265 / organism=Chromera_velia_CCMP2878 / gene_product=hypothetical protein / transcript_product=hypothetical protein / location=Cvel_scaffold243:32009-33673(+) / protein_length=555 / sequence_SO=supercontig / SO=protein_coding / is_pseudo=false